MLGGFGSSNFTSFEYFVLLSNVLNFIFLVLQALHRNLKTFEVGLYKFSENDYKHVFFLFSIFDGNSRYLTVLIF